MAQHVKYYWNDETGLPSLTNTNGSLIAILDAVLVNGFNEKTMVSVTVLNNVATAYCVSHGYGTVNSEFDLDLTIAGAAEPLINGRKDVTIVDADNFTFPAPGVADGVISGTITAKRTPLGWEKLFSGTNKAMYRSTDPTSTGLILRVDETPGSNQAYVFGCESATGVDSFVDRFPTAAQYTNGYWWAKGANNASAKPWCIIGDSKFFYWIPKTPHSGVPIHVNWNVFGDIISFRPADNYNCVLTGSYINPSSYGYSVWNSSDSSWNSTPSATQDAYIARDFIGVNKSITLSNILPTGTNGVYLNYPYPVNNGLLFLENSFAREYNVALNYPLRGKIPGLCAVVANQNNFGRSVRKVFTTTDSTPKKFLVFNVEHGSTPSYLLTVRVDGNWRA